METNLNSKWFRCRRSPKVSALTSARASSQHNLQYRQLVENVTHICRTVEPCWFSRLWRLEKKKVTQQIISYWPASWFHFESSLSECFLMQNVRSWWHHLKMLKTALYRSAWVEHCHYVIQWGTVIIIMLKFHLHLLQFKTTGFSANQIFIYNVPKEKYSLPQCLALNQTNLFLFWLVGITRIISIF